MATKRLPPAAQTDLADRLRSLLADEPVLTEKPMFGTRCFMVGDKLLVCAMKNGGLLVRVDPAEHEDLLGHPGAAQAEMGPGRTMGPGWIEVAPSAIADAAGLGVGVDEALAHNRVITG